MFLRNNYYSRLIHMPKKAFITGITDQDGSYLAEFLFSKGLQDIYNNTEQHTTMQDASFLL
jgi:GDP-D-mannose dehydratase